MGAYCDCWSFPSVGIRVVLAHVAGQQEVARDDDAPTEPDPCRGSAPSNSREWTSSRTTWLTSPENVERANGQPAPQTACRGEQGRRRDGGTKPAGKQPRRPEMLERMGDTAT